MQRNQKMGPGRHIFPLVEARKLWRTESASKECMWWWILLMALNIFRIPCAVFGLRRRCSGKDYSCQCRRLKRLGFNPWVRKIPWRRKWQPTPVSLPGKSHAQKSLAGHSPWGPRVRYDLATEQMLSLLKLWVMMAKSRGVFPSQFMVLRIRVRWRAFSY